MSTKLSPVLSSAVKNGSHVCLVCKKSLSKKDFSSLSLEAKRLPSHPDCRGYYDSDSAYAEDTLLTLEAFIRPLLEGDKDLEKSLMKYVQNFNPSSPFVSFEDWHAKACEKNGCENKLSKEAIKVLSSLQPS